MLLTFVLGHYPCKTSSKTTSLFPQKSQGSYFRIGYSVRAAEYGDFPDFPKRKHTSSPLLLSPLTFLPLQKLVLLGHGDLIICN